MSTLATLPAEPSAALRTLPRQIGRFSVRSEIGRGSNGVVYAAVDPMLGREIAIKAIPLSSDDFFRRQIEASFLQEAKAAAGLNHPGIVTVHDAGKTEDLAYIAMERLYGRDLHEFLASGQTLSATQAAALIARVADAVHYAHKQGLIHRDLKPSNIFLLRDMKPKVLDFGIALAHRAERPATHKRQLIGTPNYMSPEQALGRPLDARSDVFSLGAILYELLAGRRAFEGKDVDETVAQVIANAPAPMESLREGIPPPLLQIVQRAMATPIEDRYASAGELRNALAAFSAVAPTGRLTRGPLRPGEPAARPGWRERLAGVPLVFTGTFAVAAIAALTLALRAMFPAEPPRAAAEPPAAPRPAPSAPPAAAVPPVAAPEPVDAGSLPAAAPPAREARRAEPVRRARAEPAPAPTLPPPDGAVALAVAPWGEVFIDGISRGVSPPLTRLALEPGVHTIEIRNGDSPAFSARVEIRPGQTLSVRHRF